MQEIEPYTHNSFPALYNEARRALAQAAAIDEVKNIKDKADAMALYGRQIKDPSLESYAAEIKLRATIRLGEISKELPIHPQAKGGRVRCATKPKKDVLKEAGISKDQAYKAEMIASADKKDIEEYIEKKKATGKPVSSEEVIKTYVRKKKKEERNAKIAEIANGNPALNIEKKYPVIYADPPWQYEHSISTSRDIENQYPTMTLDDICTLDVQNLATPDAILFLWCPASHIRQALKVIDAWGFTYRTCAVWDKEKMGMGYWFRTQHELLLVAVRGNITTPDEKARPRSVVRGNTKGHSVKPEEFYGIIETMYPTLPRIELFCRKARNKWDAWGNEV